MARSRRPRIHFGINTGELLDADRARPGPRSLASTGGRRLAVARERTGGKVALQGNLDPALVFAPWEVLQAEVRRVLDDNAGHPGHIFNLGHGVLPQADPESAPASRRAGPRRGTTGRRAMTPTAVIIGGGIAASSRPTTSTRRVGQSPYYEAERSVRRQGLELAGRRPHRRCRARHVPRPRAPGRNSVLTSDSQ